MSEANREQWLAERRKGIGGSDIAALLGMSPFKTPVDLWLDKTGRADPVPDNPAMRLGRELEPAVLARYAEQTGRGVSHIGTLSDGIYVANVDALAPGRVVEAKTSRHGWDDVPEWYRAQVMWYLGFFPCVSTGDIAALFLMDGSFNIYPVHRDDETIAGMRALATDWWNRYVIADVAPPPMSEADCKALWKSHAASKTVVAVDGVRDSIGKLKTLKADAKRIADEIARHEFAVMREMQDAEILTGSDGKKLASWKKSKDSERVDWQAIAAAMTPPQELIAANTTTKIGARVFRVF